MRGSGSLDSHLTTPRETAAGSIDCPECGRALELGYDLDWRGGECPHCKAWLDEDEVGDLAEAR